MNMVRGTMLLLSLVMAPLVCGAQGLSSMPAKFDGERPASDWALSIGGGRSAVSFRQKTDRIATEFNTEGVSRQLTAEYGQSRTWVARFSYSDFSAASESSLCRGAWVGPSRRARVSGAVKRPRPSAVIR